MTRPAHVDAARSGKVVNWPPVAATMRIYDEAILDDRPAQIFGVIGKSTLLLGTYAQRAYRLVAGGNTLSGIIFQGTTVNGRKPFIQGNPAYPMLFGDQAYTSAAAVFCMSGYNHLLNLGFFDLPTGMRVRSFDRASQQVLRNEVIYPYGERCDFGMIGGNQRAGRFVGWGFGASTFETSNAPNHDVYFAGKFPKGMTPEEGDDPTNEGPTGFFDTLTENCLFQDFLSEGNLYSSVYKFTGMLGCAIRNMQARSSVCLLSLAYMRGCTLNGATAYDLRQGLTPAGEPNTHPTNQGGLILSDCHDMDLFGLALAGRPGDNYVNGVLLRDGCSDIRLRTGTISMGYTAATPDRSALRITRGSTRTYVGPGMTLRHAGGNKPLVLISASTDTVLDGPVLQQGDPASSMLVSVDSTSTGTRWRREELASRHAPGSVMANAAPGTVLQRPSVAPLLWRPTDLGAARVLTLSARQPGALVTDGATGRVIEWRDYYTAGRKLVAQTSAEGPLPLQTSGLDGVDPALQFGEPAYLRAGANAPELLATATGAINATSLALVVAVNASNGGPRNIAGWWQTVSGTPPRILLRHNAGAGQSNQVVTQGQGGSNTIVSGGTEDGQWHVIAIRKVGAMLEIYQDDLTAPLATGTIASTSPFAPNDFLLGAAVGSTTGAPASNNVGPLGAVLAIAGPASPAWDGDLHNAMRWVGRQVGVIVP
ncbi:hypothetical protein [Pseudoroseomonas cervicalis]|uniref:hypothetical protein n=1 Tax=Teichococcus cervicalis TaxID=204525 RepID=UPI002786F59B|nr:hypothetical protein [Pseudoroseomonas cervicalis]MDQ1079686.1 hypothetical protein [Pseudoroseomonas cervicalis]